MRRGDQKTPAILLIVIAVGAIFAIGRMWRNDSDKAPADERLLSHQFQMTQVDQEEARPGKVIRAHYDGKELAEYTCTVRDAAVALVEMTDGLASLNGFYRLGKAVDEKGKFYNVELVQAGDLAFVVLKGGFRVTPTSVMVPIDYYPDIVHLRQNPGQRSAAGLSLHFTKIAPAVRTLPSPDETQARTTEQMAHAEFVQSKNMAWVKVVGKLPSDEYLIPHIVEASFMPPQVNNGALADIGWGEQYLAQSDAVKVRLERYRRTSQLVTAIYRNARFADINGVRALDLPTTQQIGILNGCPLTVAGFRKDAFRGAHLKHAHGDVFIHLGVQAPNNPPVLAGALRCISVSPTVAQMGLDWVDLTVDGYLYSELIKPAGPPLKTLISRIPELTMTFKLDRALLIGSSTVVLPLHHVQNDPVVFPQKIAGAAFGPPTLSVPSVPAPRIVDSSG